MLHRLLILLVLVVGPALLPGLTGCNPCNPAPYRFGILEYRPFPRKLTNQLYKSYLADTLLLTDSVTYRQLELILIGQQTTVASNDRRSGGATVWACDPAVIAVDSIHRLTVTTDQSYSTTLGAGSDLASVLTIGEGSYDQRPLAEFFSTSPVRAQPFYSLRLSQAPAKAGRYQFRVTVSWGQGKTSRFLTRPILITD